MRGNSRKYTGYFSSFLALLCGIICYYRYVTLEVSPFTSQVVLRKVIEAMPSTSWPARIDGITLPEEVLTLSSDSDPYRARRTRPVIEE